MPELELALFAFSIAMNATLWYKLGKLEKDIADIKRNIVTTMRFKN